MREVDTDPVGHLDLKTLRLLGVLLETVSVTRSAERMGMSQPAASRAVARLRSALRDPLLVRTRSGYSLTTRAEALQVAVELALAAVDGVFAGPGFEPATTRRAFRVASTDYGVTTVLVPFAPRLVGAAPQARLDVVPFGADTFAGLESGAIDVALWSDGPLPPDFHHRRLFRDGYACVVRPGHPLARASSPRQVLRVLPRFGHVVFLYPSGSRLVPDDVLAELGVSDAHVAVRTPYLTSGPRFVAGTDLVMCMPRRMAEATASAAGLVVVPLPRDSLAFEYRVLWHERSHRDPGLAWFRTLLREAFG